VCDRGLYHPRLEQLISERTFPLPVKDTKGNIVFVKSEIDGWYSKQPKRNRRFKKDG